ncbi:MAG: hypothetical protein PHY73_05815, partial [Candidatus Omnitrophica bacterium]|nr:hypothetical protein [Candidatus Omnitrophota bacterium]
TSDDYYCKMLFQSPEYFRKDMEYLGKRYSSQHNVGLFLANTNFGLFEKDFEIAKIIRETQDKYDWPKVINVNSGKDPDKLLKTASILKYKFSPSIALQTLTPKVLKNIGRKNIEFEKFVDFQKTVSETIDKNTSTELILNLPGETKSSFLEVISSVLNSSVERIVIYTLMALRGTPLASKESAQKYDYDMRYRVVPRCFTEIDGIKIFEPEKVVVGTKDMSFDDYLYLRGLSLIITIFDSSVEMAPIKKFLADFDINIDKWIFGIHSSILDSKVLRSIYNNFMDETEKELFKSINSLKSFFNKKENYELLCSGKLGDNLSRKYKTIFLSQCYGECLKVACAELRVLAKKKEEKKQCDDMIDALESYLESRDINYLFEGKDVRKEPRNIVLKYDIPKWLENKNNKTLKKYKGEFLYSVVVTDYAYNRVKNFYLANRDPQLSLQILFRDGDIKDFWPKWNYSERK